MTTESKIRVLIVDDEPLGRNMLRQMLELRSDVRIVGECLNGEEAAEMAIGAMPDMVFLDVQMPKVNGFEFLEKIAGEDQQPAVIFVTAFDEYAIRAFDVNAADYLLKPYSQERFDQAFERAVQQIENRGANEINAQLRKFLAERKSPEQFVERFVIKSGGRVFFLKEDEVFWIEAEGNYVLLHTKDTNHIFREAISKLEQKLNPHKFQRIGRSTIVNIDYVSELQPWFRGNYRVILKDGTELKLSPHYRPTVNKYFGGSL
ncbi:MAG: response regulator transcription factor [Pyrinomonadaceae bacterium]|nr:response regulator transcription factor [Pyrinomonadaceae bacterium]